MEQITINVAALCDVGGRKNNQDNIFLSCRDALQSNSQTSPCLLSGKQIAIPSMGTILLVADGMGGMNSGEVASQLVVDSVAREIKSLEGQALNDPEQVSAMARRVIVDADSAIKQHVAAHPELSGTGSTVVLLWLLGSKAVVAWCGDSRCYRYNPRRGLEQLSHDHSYVQQLVDEGKLRPELAFGHDQSNIITRCLSDDKEVAAPDVKVIDVYRDDMFLLCSDGLCGLLPDAVTEQLLKDADGDTGKALSNCWSRGSAEGWNDNVSIILVSVDGVDAIAPVRDAAPLPPRPSYTTVTVEPDDSPASPHADAPVSNHGGKSRKRALLWLLLVAVLLAVLIFLLARGRDGDDMNCKTCGKPFAECEYRGRHPQPQNSSTGGANTAGSQTDPTNNSGRSGATGSQNTTTNQQRGVRMEGNTIVCTVDGAEYRYKMVYVSGGTFTMGCTGEQGSDWYNWEKPAHNVSVSGFYIGQTEVTQALWKAVMGSNPSNWKGNTLPVERVSYDDCLEFINKLNSLTGQTFRLPTEAEWEYAARGGNSSQHYKYSGSDDIGTVAWYWENSDSGSGRQTHPVAQKQANELGLYDMNGNVWEWCSDWYGDYSSSATSNPKGPSMGSGRVYRGGGWDYGAGGCRVSYRISGTPSFRLSHLGLRLAR